MKLGKSISFNAAMLFSRTLKDSLCFISFPWRQAYSIRELRSSWLFCRETLNAATSCACFFLIMVSALSFSLSMSVLRPYTRFCITSSVGSTYGWAKMTGSACFVGFSIRRKTSEISDFNDSFFLVTWSRIIGSLRFLFVANGLVSRVREISGLRSIVLSLSKSRGAASRRTGLGCLERGFSTYSSS